MPDPEQQYPAELPDGQPGDAVDQVETDRVDAELERRFNELREGSKSSLAAVLAGASLCSAELILSLAQLLHECARPAVADVQDWVDLTDEAREGRLLMAAEFIRLFLLRSKPVQLGLAGALLHDLGPVVLFGPRDNLSTFVAGALAAARGLQTGERSERNRHLAIAVTDLEKVHAWAVHLGL